ncbi:MAG: tetratricopeptide repeat protein [Thermoanaerobaculia bacterium]
MKRNLLAALAVALLLALALWRVDGGRRMLRASRLVAAVERRTAAALRLGKLQSSMFESHLAALREAAELDRGEIAIPIAEGSQYLLLGRAEPAIEAYRRALALEPRPETYLNLGKAMLLEGENQRAQRMFRKAVLLDPRLASFVPRP